jgi:polar amino acid transport system substrate-binding protein
MTMSAMNDTSAREAYVDFVDYLVDGIGIEVQAGNPDKVTGPMSLCGQSVAVVSGTTQATYATTLSAQCTAAGQGAVTAVISSGTPQEQLSLTTGRVAAVLNDNITDAYDQATQPSVFEAINYKPIEPGPYGIGINKADPGLRSAVRTALQNLMTDGIYGKILTAWNISSVGITKATINGAVSLSNG